MPAAESVERRGSSSGWRVFFPLVLVLPQVLVVGRSLEELSPPRATLICLAIPLRRVLPGALRGLATRFDPTRKILPWFVVSLVSVPGFDILKRLHHRLRQDPFLDHVHQRLTGRTPGVLDSAPSVGV